MTKRPVHYGLLAACWVLGCGGQEDGRVVEAAPLAKDSFAVVGDRQLGQSLLKPFEESERPTAARSIVHDALLSRAARDRLPHLSKSARRGVLARALFERLQEQALERGPVTKEERMAAEKRLWLQVDRPRAVRTAHVFVAVPPLEDDTEEYELAQRIQEAVEGSPNIEAFVDAANSIIRDGEQARFQRRPPVAADGRVVPVAPGDETGPEKLEPNYAEAASKLKHPGDVSGVVGTKDGFRILVATEIIPARRPKPEERKRLVETSVARERGTRLLEKVKAEARQEARVQLNPNHANLTRLPWRERERER